MLRAVAPAQSFAVVAGRAATHVFASSASGGYLTLENPYNSLTVIFWTYIGGLPLVTNSLFCLRSTNNSLQKVLDMLRDRHDLTQTSGVGTSFPRQMRC
jgi:hypothetical protein